MDSRLSRLRQFRQSYQRLSAPSRQNLSDEERLRVQAENEGYRKGVVDKSLDGLSDKSIEHDNALSDMDNRVRSLEIENARQSEAIRDLRWFVGILVSVVLSGVGLLVLMALRVIPIGS